MREWSRGQGALQNEVGVANDKVGEKLGVGVGQGKILDIKTAENFRQGIPSGRNVENLWHSSVTLGAKGSGQEGRGYVLK